MASRMYAVKCGCGQAFYLEDEMEGECPSCGEPVKYEPPLKTLGKATGKKAAGRKKDVLDDGSPAAVKYTAK